MCSPFTRHRHTRLCIGCCSLSTPTAFIAGDAECTVACPLCRLSWHASCSHRTLESFVTDSDCYDESDLSVVLFRVLQQEFEKCAAINTTAAANSAKYGWHATVGEFEGWQAATSQLDKLESEGTVCFVLSVQCMQAACNDTPTHVAKGRHIITLLP
jgi:hypothetical protein